MLWRDIRDIYGSQATYIARQSSGDCAARLGIFERAGATGRSGAGKLDSAAVVEALVGPNQEPDNGLELVDTVSSLARPFASRPIQHDPNGTFKRVFDFVVALIGIVALSPLFVAVAIALTLDTRGPIFFRQWRGGQNGQRFQIWKFRTMTCLEDGADVCQACPGDARVTRVGRFLRKTSIDELPQLFNVVRGDMSLVGPRPHALIHDAIYSRLIKGYEDRQLVRPGMTGWAQVNGCRGETRDIAAMERRVERDLEYIRHWSLRFDLLIMAKTVNELVRASNAY
ncbi:exopolysaccharide biosynthesis polyprenyl glycosylphosphotransferase [Bradyrhizobium sp. ARR65]|uniref:exopolysaccharide biosynthesis polyprenyl glycosylphosphotransferase n=1 Tax=Bradyrhizobium sp. ARR65 TaxID=1040989 RepID=UPI00046625CA|nr:exopolysaccharide biosynthesis polyprenyl glycosylphosphotransferase [Bradyrhizobium sp. ARR65]